MQNFRIYITWTIATEHSVLWRPSQRPEFILLSPLQPPYLCSSCKSGICPGVPSVFWIGAGLGTICLYFIIISWPCSILEWFFNRDLSCPTPSLNCIFSQTYRAQRAPSAHCNFEDIFWIVFLNVSCRWRPQKFGYPPASLASLL